MPSALRPPHAPTPPPPTRAALSHDDQADISAIDASLDALLARDVFTSRDPYILAIPQTVEPRYHHRGPFPAFQYTDNAPFDSSEWENLQYQTYHYHDPETSMYRQDVTIYPDKSAKAAPADRARTPNVGPKKVMSLDAYKKQKSGGTPLADAQGKDRDRSRLRSEISHSVDQTKAESVEIVAAVESADSGDVVSQEADVPGKKNELKRKRDDDADEAKDSTQLAADTPTSAKKPRTTDSAPASEKPAASPSARPRASVRTPERRKPVDDPAEEQERSMPPRLSPLRKAYDVLPDRLSPTLPPNIRASLGARADGRSSSSAKAPPSPSRKNGKLTPLPTANGVKKHKSPVPKNGFRASSNSPGAQADSLDEKKLPTPPRSSGARGDTAAHSLVVKLRFRSSLRDHLRKMSVISNTKAARETPSWSRHDPSDGRVTPDRASKPSTTRDEGNAADRRTGKGVAQKIRPADRAEDKPPVSEKRARPAEEDVAEPAAKRAKPPDATDPKLAPSTPVQHPARSPDRSQKMQPATPTSRKDLRAVAMKRTLSNDSTTHTTPTRSTTPAVNGHAFVPQGATRPPSSQPSSKTAAQQSWEAEQRRLESLGRELKHAAEAESKTSSSSTSSSSSAAAATAASSPESKLAAVKALESLIAYLLAFTCADEAAHAAADPRQQPPSPKPWRTLAGFFSFVKRHCAPFPPLAGLAAMLGLAFASHILALAEASPVDAPALLEAAVLARRCAVDLDARLDVDALAATFPRAWEGRARGPPSAADAALSVAGLLRGAYKLPVGMQTLPVRAARAGRAMLGEWVLAQGLEYRLRSLGPRAE